MRDNGTIKKNGSKNRMHSIGFRVGITIAILLLLILGTKAASDIIYNYKTTTESEEKTKLEETRKLAKSLELFQGSSTKLC